MCQTFSQVTQLDEDRYVEQCEHGSVALTWWHCTWNLHLGDFLTLATLMLKDEGQVGCFVLDSYESKHLLWCGDACMVLKNERFGELRSLVCQAALLMTGRGPDSAFSCERHLN